MVLKIVKNPFYLFFKKSLLKNSSNWFGGEAHYLKNTWATGWREGVGPAGPWDIHFFIKPFLLLRQLEDLKVTPWKTIQSNLIKNKED
jgi:hypothetical protein